MSRVEGIVPSAEEEEPRAESRERRNGGRKWSSQRQEDIVSPRVASGGEAFASARRDRERDRPRRCPGVDMEPGAVSSRDRERESARSGGRAGLPLGRRCRGGGSRCRSRAIGFATRFRASTGRGGASGHGGLAASLQSVIAALAPTSEFCLPLSHRVPPFGSCHVNDHE